MTTSEIFEGITTTELISYLAAGDNSKELRDEIQARAGKLIESRTGNVTNVEADARYNG